MELKDRYINATTSSGFSPLRRCDRRKLNDVEREPEPLEFVLGGVDRDAPQRVSASAPDVDGGVEVPVEVSGACGVGTTAQPTDRESRGTSPFLVARGASDLVLSTLCVDVVAWPTLVAAQAARLRRVVLRRHGDHEVLGELAPKPDAEAWRVTSVADLTGTPCDAAPRAVGEHERRASVSL